MTSPDAPRPLTMRCAATKPRLDPTLPPKRCPRPAKYGEWCRQHAESLGGWRLAPAALAAPSGQPDLVGAVSDEIETDLEACAGELAEARHQLTELREHARRFSDSFVDPRTGIDPITLLRDLTSPEWHDCKCDVHEAARYYLASIDRLRTVPE